MHKNARRIFIIFIISNVIVYYCVQKLAQKQCYWMENYSGEYEWVPANHIYGINLNKEDCFKLDSCNGGLGYSVNGCYKWAQTPEEKPKDWDRNKWDIDIFED